MLADVMVPCKKKTMLPSVLNCLRSCYMHLTISDHNFYLLLRITPVEENGLPYQSVDNCGDRIRNLSWSWIGYLFRRREGYRAVYVASQIIYASLFMCIENSGVFS